MPIDFTEKMTDSDFYTIVQEVRDQAKYIASSTLLSVTQKAANQSNNSNKKKEGDGKKRSRRNAPLGTTSEE